MKEVIKKYVPGAKFIWRKLYKAYKLRKSKKTKLIFTEKYSRNGWGSTESVSGYGSELRQTKNILHHLPSLFEKYEIKTILDIPCGDFNWMRHLKYSFLKYTGGDIVNQLIERNVSKYSNYGEFRVLNLIKDPLPRVDLIFCRDCLVHLSYEDIRSALKNVKASGATYLMTTTFTVHDNEDILTGDWRPVNFSAEPFHFPAPLEILNEGSDEPGNKKDKSLALWFVKDIK